MTTTATTMTLDNMTLEEGIDSVTSIVNKFSQVDSSRIRFNSATLGEIRKLRAAAICDFGRLQLLQGIDKAKEAELQMNLQVQERIIDVYEHLLSLHDTTTTSNEEDNNV